VNHEVQPAEPAVSDKPKRRWFQFSLRTMFIVITISAAGGAWWNHRDFCLKKCRFHSGQHLTFADIFIPQNEDSDCWDGEWEFLEDGRPVVSRVNCSYAPSGFKRLTLTVKQGVLPEFEQEIKSRMDREATLADQYFHAIWRPWERLWVKVEPQQPKAEDLLRTLLIRRDKKQFN
jgi:hypothetical protein